MKHALPAAIVLSLLAGGLAQAQTTSPNATSPNATGTTAPAANAPDTNATGTGALGTSATGLPNNSSTSTNTAVATTGNGGQNGTRLVPGANSFTQGEAQSRIQSQGFAEVSGLKLDDQGIWRGTATKDGKSAQVALDYQGNVVAQ